MAESCPSGNVNGSRFRATGTPVPNVIASGCNADTIPGVQMPLGHDDELIHAFDVQRLDKAFYGCDHLGVAHQQLSESSVSGAPVPPLPLRERGGGEGS